MIITNFAYILSFCDAVDLVAHCGGKEISTHLIMAPENMTYIFPENISKYINIMGEFIKKPLHSTMKGNNIMSYSNETQEITPVE